MKKKTDKDKSKRYRWAERIIIIRTLDMEIHFNGFISQSLAHYNNYIVYNDVIIQSYMHYTFLVQDREYCQEREN